VRQAAALAEALVGHAFNEPVTKADLKAELKDLELRLTIRMIALNAATIAILGTLITFD